MASTESVTGGLLPLDLPIFSLMGSVMKTKMVRGGSRAATQKSDGQASPEPVPELRARGAGLGVADSRTSFVSLTLTGTASSIQAQ